MNPFAVAFLISFAISLILEILANTEYGKYLVALYTARYKHLRDALPPVESISYPHIANIGSITREGSIRLCRVVVLPRTLQIASGRTGELLMTMPIGTVRSLKYIDRTVRGRVRAGLIVNTQRGQFQFTDVGILARYRMMKLAKIIKVSHERAKVQVLPLVRVPAHGDLSVSSMLHDLPPSACSVEQSVRVA